MYYPPLPPLKSTIKRLPRMPEKRLKNVRKLIQAKCCNYIDDGHCIALDDGIDDHCPQWYSYSLLCKWFRYAVLPNDPLLQAEILENITKMDEITGKKAPFINIVGGGTKEVPLCKLTANACGRPVYTGPVEATALGNIAVQAIAQGETIIPGTNCTAVSLADALNQINQ